MSAGRICTRVVATAAQDETVLAAARRMADNDVGTVIVLGSDEDQTPVGILTDRDIAIRCVARGIDPEETTVRKLMSTPVQSVDESTPIEETVAKMARSSTRRLVVTGTEGHLVGIISLDDILELLTEEAGAIARLLEKQVPHIPA